MKSVLRVLGAVAFVLAVTWVTLIATGHSIEELQHLGEPRNVLDDNGRQVPLPIAQGPAERRVPEVPVTTTGAYAFITVDDDGVPVRVDPCRPVHWVIATADMPEFARAEVMAAVEDIAARTGLEFVFDGETDEVAAFDRSVFQDRYGEGYAPLIIGWSDEARTPDLAGTVSGVGGSSAIPGAFGTQRYLRSGVVILDVVDLQSYLASTSGALQVRAIIMHELAHALGLAHVEDPAQLMHPTNNNQLTWGDGDLAGLAIAGAGPCE